MVLLPLGVQWYAALRWSAEALPMDPSQDAVQVRNPEPVVLDVFISYADADWKIARALASDLENRGRTVWWDGYPYEDYTERSLAARDAARVVIVIWSADACKSD